MNKNIILLIIIVILIGLVGYLILAKKPETPQSPESLHPATSSAPQTASSTPKLSRETALSLLGMKCSSEKVPGEYGSCSVNISKEKDQWVVTITYDGLYDDSIKARRVKTTVTYKDGQWIKGKTFQTQQCWPGHGHQDFSAESCI